MIYRKCVQAAVFSTVCQVLGLKCRELKGPFDQTPEQIRPIRRRGDLPWSLPSPLLCAQPSIWAGQPSWPSQQTGRSLPADVAPRANGQAPGTPVAGMGTGGQSRRAGRVWGSLSPGPREDTFGC